MDINNAIKRFVEPINYSAPNYVNRSYRVDMDIKTAENMLNHIAYLEQRLAAAEAKIPDKPLGVFSEGVWVFATTAQTFTAEDLDIAAFVKYRDYMKGGE